MNASVDPRKLVQLIVYYATERDLRLTTIRLIKFLYLADLYHARHNQGRTLSGWPWKFWKFGPWCTEAWKAVQDAIEADFVEARKCPSEFGEEDYCLFEVRLRKEPALESALPAYVTSPLKVAVKRWGDDTYALLDHVYFETEPMEEVQRGQLLDFDKARPPERPSEIVMRQLPEVKIQEGKKLLAAMKEKLSRGQTLAQKLVADQVIDEPYLAAMEYLEDEDLAPGLTGRAEIKELEA